MKSRQEIKALAKEAMKMQRGTAIGLLIVFMVAAIAAFIPAIIVAGVTGSMGLLYWIFYIAAFAVLMVLMVNSYGEHIKIYKRENASIGALFSGFQVNFLRKLGGMAWMMLFVYLWSLLLVIPGIIKALSYFCTYFILADCPNVTARQALKLSMRITRGHKMDIFVFSLSFLGWIILSGFTLYILYFVFVGPYMYTSFSGL